MNRFAERQADSTSNFRTQKEQYNIKLKKSKKKEG